MFAVCTKERIAIMNYSEIREFDLKLSGKSGKYQGISFHELARNPDIVQFAFQI